MQIFTSKYHRLPVLQTDDASRVILYVPPVGAADEK